jgi:hypothetical protein
MVRIETVKSVGIRAEVRRHHFLGFLLGLSHLVQDRGLLAVAIGSEPLASLLCLLGLLAHLLQPLHQLLVLDQALDLLGRPSMSSVANAQ